MQRHTVIALAHTGVTLVVLLWFLSIMIDCDHFLARSCDQAIWASWLDLWRLGWVQKYKELIAGILAAAAGVTAYFAVQAQIRDGREREAERRARAARIVTTVVASELARVALLLQSNAVDPEDASMKGLQEARAELGNIDPAALNMFMTGSHMIQLGLKASLGMQQSRELALDPEMKRRRDKALIYSLMLWNYFASTNEILDENGSFRFSRVDSSAVERQMREHALIHDEATLRMFSLLFGEVQDAALLPQ